MFSALFTPKSIALIGASNQKGTVGNDLLQNLKNQHLFLVNPKHTEIEGISCYHSVKDIPETVDLAIIAVPATYVAQILEEIGACHIPSALIISAGFKEIGEEGLLREHEIQNIAQKYSIDLLGPNCLGFINTYNNLNCSFSRSFPGKGNISFISQSGAMCTTFIEQTRDLDLGFSYCISTGNKALIDECQLLEFLEADTNTEVILMYVESIQNARRFIGTVKKITKPIIVLKAGNTSFGNKAAISHTGALASDSRLYDALFRQSNVIVAQTIEELTLLAQTASQNSSWIKQTVANSTLLEQNITIVTNAGGPGVLAADSVAHLGLKLYNTEVLKKQLQTILPQSSNINNPIDLLGDATKERYEQTLEILKEAKTDCILVILTPQSSTDIIGTAQAIINQRISSKTRVFVSFLGGKIAYEAKQLLLNVHVSFFDYPEEAAFCFEKLSSYINQAITNKLSSNNTIEHTLNRQNLAQKTIYNEKDTRLFLQQCNIPISDTTFVDFSQPIEGQFSFDATKTYAIKIVSDDIFHKVDVGGVILNVKPDELYNSIQKMRNNIQTKLPNVRLEGVLVTEMIDISSDLQLIVGIKNDPVLGHALVCGLGGTFVELFKDVVFGFPPLSTSDIQTTLKQLHIYPALNSYRGKLYNINVLIDLLQKVSDLVLLYPEITELDLNPCLLTEQSITVLDAKMIVQSQS